MDRRVGGGPLRTAVDRGDRPVDQRVGGRPLRNAGDRGDRPVDQKVGLESLTISLFVSSYLI